MYGNHISKEITDYCDQMTHFEDPLLRELRMETHKRSNVPQMLSGHLEGRLLKMLVQLVGAHSALEIGTFTGYSALCIAEGLPNEGHLITCDIDKEACSIAEKYFSKSPHGKKITLKIGPALETIHALKKSLDFVFIDADKINYKHYYEAVLPKLRRGGVIVIDNCFWSGKVLSPYAHDKETIAIAETNELVSRDERVENVLLSIRDGVNVIRKL